MTPKSLSPSGDCKTVSFQLRGTDAEPKTFYIRPHDTTDSIMDTVKHLFGLSRQYELGISLEDCHGLSFIPSHENFADGMMVYVRIEDSLPRNFAHRHSYDLRRSHPAASRSSASYSASSRSVSPQSRGRRSCSAAALHGRPRSLKRPAAAASQAAATADADADAEPELWHPDAHWYLPHQSLLPDEEEEPRTKAASVASADISLENIVEGSRRKRPKFSADVRSPPRLPTRFSAR